MKTNPPRAKKYLFVCENAREDGRCCMPQGAQIREKLKKAVKDKGLAGQVRVSRSGCLDMCEEGPNVLLMPDNKWFSGVGLDDLEPILKEAGRGLA